MKDVDGQLDFPAAMDWLGRESKSGKTLIIDLTRRDDHESRSDDSSVISKQNSNDSDYRDGSSDSKPPHKERLGLNKENISDKGDCSSNGDDDLNISSSEEDISVDETNDSNNNYPDDLFNVLYGNRAETCGLRENELYDKSQQDDKVEGQDFEEDDKVENESVQVGIQHQDKSGGLQERQHDVDEDEGVQDGQQQLDTSGGLEDTDKEQQQDYRLDNTEKDTLSKSQRKRLRKKKRTTEMSDREQEEDQEGDHESYKKGEDSADEVDKQKKKKKKRKKQSSDGI
jgi:hypothetical protein